MKKILKLIALSAFLLIFGVGVVSCEEHCDTSITKPPDLLPIDWYGYNDVFTVWWNFRSNDGVPHEDLIQERTVKIYGKFGRYAWHFGGRDLVYFYLIDEQERDFFDPGWVSENPYAIHITFFPDSSINKEELLTQLGIWASLPKRFYVRGSLASGAGGPDRCPSSIYPRIILNSLDDIYFETN